MTTQQVSLEKKLFGRYEQGNIRLSHRAKLDLEVKFAEIFRKTGKRSLLSLGFKRTEALSLDEIAKIIKDNKYADSDEEAKELAVQTINYGKYGDWKQDTLKNGWNGYGFRQIPQEDGICKYRLESFYSD